MITNQFDWLDSVVAWLSRNAAALVAVILSAVLSLVNLWYTKRLFKIKEYPRVQINIGLEVKQIPKSLSQRKEWCTESLLSVKLRNLRPDVTVSDTKLSIYISHLRRGLRFRRKRWLVFTTIHKAEPMPSDGFGWNLSWDDRPTTIENIGSCTLEDFLAENLPIALKPRPLDLKAELTYQPGLVHVKPISITKYYVLYTSHTPQEGQSPDETRLFAQRLEPK